METSQLIAPIFPNISLSFLANTPLLLIVLVLFLILYIVVSSVLLYHWSEYGMRTGAVILAETVFVLVSLVLFAVSFLSLSYF